MSKVKMRKLIKHLTEAAKELLQDHDLGPPDNFTDFMRCMWQDDMDMKTWGATREEYTHALRTAYELYDAPSDDQ